MLKNTVFVLSVSLLLASCAGKPSQEAGQTSQASGLPIDTIAERYFISTLGLNPFYATSIGLEGYNDKFENELTDDWRARYKALQDTTNAQLATVDTTKLSADQYLTYQFIRYSTKDNLEGLEFPYHLMPITQMGSLAHSMAINGSGANDQPFKTVQDYDNWLVRVAAFPAWGDTAIANMRKGIAQKVVLNKLLTGKTIPQLEALQGGKLEDHVFYKPILNLPASFSAAEKERLTAAYTKAITEQVMPTYTKLASYLKTEYMPAGRTTTGIKSVPNGAAWYAYAARSGTTTNLSPDSIYAIGVGEVARIEKEMLAVKDRMAFKGTLKEFFEYLKTDKKFRPYTDPAQVLAAFEAIHQRVNKGVGKLFNVEPKTPFEIRRVEAFREKSSPAQYSGGSADGTRPGIFYLPIPDVKSFTISSGMESLFIHEAIPGHHFQISLAQENTSLPNIRRFGGQNAYAEGWALYCESLGKELGMYTDDVQYMGALGDEMHRAIRLVVDVGMHHKDMTREQAIAYMMAHEQLDEAGTVLEIERYMAWPGQALGYKIGALKIRSMRTQLEKEQGDMFDIKAFHKAVLMSGSLPLSVLEANVMKK